MERDALGIVVALLACVGAAVVIVVLSKLFGRRTDESRSKRDTDLNARAALATKRFIRLDSGSIVPKCLYCEHQALHRPFRWVRDDGLVDLVRRMFGAPARVRIGRETWEVPAHCEAHDPLVFEEFRIEHSKYETDKAELERTWEVRRARFQRDGVKERAFASIAKHEREIGGRKRKDPKSNVVPFGHTRLTGTETK